ncbi:cold shock domain-containing protein [Candidatus Pseudomonas adelgestsugas]|uniref:Major cold shock protein CspA n=1 Tax=Candidatus Pseudomonas adelgestsugas TaxID=1302376 RepID=A0ABX5RA09_9PSED|nr:cold shock domain-containing protein [Candidatus Pseudomonas adelgestsugas]QAX82222.1 Major cold shock protein CspA [Candidatus Pseudomonas adelgestsugas]
MLKIVHLLTGVIALLLSLIPSMQPEKLPYLEQQDALYLVLFGLINMTLAPMIHYWHKSTRHQLQHLVSALLVLTVIVQAIFLLVPIPEVGGHRTILVSLMLAIVAIVLHIAINLSSSSYVPVVQHYNITNRDTGTVKWFNTSKGFGFISRDSGDDIFVHFRAIRGDGQRILIEGQRVEFSIINRDKGLQAEDVITVLPPR